MDMKKFTPRGNLTVFAVLLAAVFLTYLPSLRYDFIMDDQHLIVNNSYIKNIRLWPKIFTTDTFHFQPKMGGFAKYYRPLQPLSFAFEYRLWGLNPAGYRLTNILIHALNAFLFFLLVSLLFQERKQALLSAAIFGLLPIQPYLVTFISSRFDLLQTFFFLLSMLLFCRSHTQTVHRLRLYLLSLACFLLALLSREGALLLPLFLVFCVLFMDERKKGLLSVIPYAAVALGYLQLRTFFMPCGKLNPISALSAHNVLEYFRLCFSYFQQLVLPIDFQLFLKNHAMQPLFFACTAVLAVCLGREITLRRPAFFGGLVFFAGLLPVMSLLRSGMVFHSVISEHYAYISSLGFSLLLASLLMRLEKRGRAATIVLSLSLFFFASLAVVNSTNYRDEPSFDAYVRRHDPDNPLAPANLADYYLSRGETDKARGLAKRLVDRELEPEVWRGYLILGKIAAMRSEPGEAEYFLREASERNPHSGEALYRLAGLYSGLAQDDKALAFFRKAVETAPEFAPGLQAFGEFLRKKGLYREAVTVGEKAVAYAPDSSSVRVSLGIALASSGRYHEAERRFIEALRIDPRNVEARMHLGEIYRAAGSREKALAQWRAALEIDPGNQEAAALVSDSKPEGKSE